jgi:predicted RNA methylase
MAEVAGDCRGLRVLDPAGGAGTLLKWAFPGASHEAIEIDRLLADECRRNGVQVACGNALEIAEPWLRTDVIGANPPFSLLEAFVRRALYVLKAAAETGRSRTAHILLPTGWLQAAARADLPEPDLTLLTWRPQFIVEDDASGPSATYAIATWTTASVVQPRTHGHVRRIARPAVSASLLADYERVNRLFSEIPVLGEQAVLL